LEVVTHALQPRGTSQVTEKPHERVISESACVNAKPS
jgi:hypothetical protein